MRKKSYYYGSLAVICCFLLPKGRSWYKKIQNLGVNHKTPEGYMKSENHLNKD